MLAVESWGRALAAVLLLCGTVELLLPPGATKGYARSFLGLLVVLSVLQPVAGLLHGQLRLQLPAAGAAAGPAPPAPAAARVFEGLVASGAASTAAAVPGVESATASVRFGPAPAGSGEPVAPVSARVTAAAAAGAARGSLGAAVARAVAADLGLAAGAVAVTVT